VALEYSLGIEATPPTPRPAATVILIRRGGRHRQRGLEVLMLRRGADARFMPGVWVFAGGVVDPADRESAAAAAAERPAGIADDEWAHRICAARELAEEGAVSVPAAGLLPWSRWITPAPVPARFDTRFYVALAPAHSKPEPDRVEMDAARWIEPTEALRAGAANELEISFPTVRNLESLLGFASAEEVLEAAADRIVEPILPRVVGTRESFRVLVPGDPGYEEAASPDG
jgi:8-oxo-dGTP pyrophosphatase MutT (NUDIX family)